jgi:hypothetical protein
LCIHDLIDFPPLTLWQLFDFRNDFNRAHGANLTKLTKFPERILLCLSAAQREKDRVGSQR